MAGKSTKVPETEQEKQKAAYVNATRRLREDHRENFNKLRIEEADKLGVKWTPKPTEEEKAAEQLARLIETYPHLADELRKGSQPGRDDVGTSPVEDEDEPDEEGAQ